MVPVAAVANVAARPSQTANGVGCVVIVMEGAGGAPNLMTKISAEVGVIVNIPAPGSKSVAPRYRPVAYRLPELSVAMEC